MESNPDLSNEYEAQEWLNLFERASHEDALHLAPHVYDVVNQLIDHRIRARNLWEDQQRSLRSGSISSKRRVFRSLGEDDLVRQLKVFEKTSKTIRHAAGSPD